MNKKAENTFQFPFQVEREYHLLMKTKESFLKKITNAECRKLETLYEQLNDVWNQNNTEELSETLNQRYQELREIQKQKEKTLKEYEEIINLELKHFEKEYEQLLTQGISKTLTESSAREQNLMERSSNYKSSLEMKKLHLPQQLKNTETDLKKNYQNSILSLSKKSKSDIEIWKNDINESNQRLSEKRKMLNEISEKQTNLSGDLNQQLQTILEISQKNKEKLKILKELLVKNQELKKNIEIKSNQLKRKSEESEKNLYSINIKYQNDLKLIENSLKRDLNSFVNNLLIELKVGILKRMNIPEDTKNFLRTWSKRTITSLLNETLENTKKRGDALRQALIRIGMTEQEFFEKMEKYERSI